MVLEAFSELEKKVLRFTDDVVANDRTSDDTFDPLAGKLSKTDMVELVIAIGFYVFTSKFLMSLLLKTQIPAVCLRSPQIFPN